MTLTEPQYLDPKTSRSTPGSFPVTPAEIDAASKRLQGIARLTPTQPIERLTDSLGVPVLVKREDLQRCRSFKLRGAYNRIAQLSAEEREAGVVCASAGNHAQGVAISCSSLGIKGTIFLPSSTPRQKRERIAYLGGDWVEMVFVDGVFDDAQIEAQRVANKGGKAYIHPYDDPAVIAGQGSVAKEISDQLGEELAAVVVPIGGGGLIAGMALWLKQNRPEVRIIGVEPTGAPSVTASLNAGEPTRLAEIDSFVDGTAVALIGDATFQIIRSLVDQVITVPEGAVCRELLDLYHIDGIIAEPAGALASAVLSMAANGELPALDLPGTTVAIVSGGNNDLSRYDEVQERSLVYQGLRHYFLVSFPQRPGALREFLDRILGPGDDILYFEYMKKNNRETGPALVGIDIQRRDDIHGLRQRMGNSDLQIEELDADSELLRFLI